MNGQLEQNLYRQYWDDGLLDLFAGVGVLGIGLFWIFDVVVGAAILPALLVPLWAPFREKITEPRMGLVEFSSRREQRTQKFLVNVFLAGTGTFLLALLLYFYVRSNGLPANVTFIAGLPAGLLGVLAVFGALLTGAYRFFIYGAWLVIAGLTCALAGTGPGAPMVVGGAAITFCAVVLLTRFIRKYPATPGGV